MNESLFSDILDKYFKLVMGEVSERINGKANEGAYLHETMLTEEYSADLHWGATSINHSVVAADVVSMESSLPLKKRSSFGTATGTLPKVGLKYRKGEKLISDINVMRARGVNEDLVASKILDDVAKGIKAIKVRNEIDFLTGLSTGVILVADGTDNGTDNHGTGIRVDFGYRAENQFKAKHVWTSTSTSAVPTPKDDIQQLFDKALADGNSIAHVYMSQKYFNLFRNSDQGKMLAAAFSNVVVTAKNLVPTPSNRQFLEALEDEFGAKFHVINNTYKVENEDGTLKTVAPWAEANVIAVPSDKVGRLVYGTLAEETNPVNGVSYQKSGNYTLISKYSKTDPLEEYTTAQALVLPVIDGADSIYLLDASQAQ